MKIEFVSIDEASRMRERGKGGLMLYAFEAGTEIFYEKELKGETACFEENARLSKLYGGVIVRGMITNSRGIRRKSALVAEDGKISGISDALHVFEGDFSPGANLRVYKTKFGRMGVVIDEDIFFPEVFRSLTLCGSDFIVCICGKGEEERLRTLLLAYAILYGVPLYYCSEESGWIVDGNGVCFSASENSDTAEYIPAEVYQLVESRRRGNFKRTE